jgi:protein-S-isoprenylcysteine O-methyltransferase Ste14
MRFLELKIPPPVVALLVALGMWAISRAGAPPAISLGLRLGCALAIALGGGAIAIAGERAFHRARTTVNPMKPQAASSLVTTGVFRMTRNPMYLGLLSVLLAWAVFLCSAWALAGPPAFVLYISRFQIAPEERVLAAKFGETYCAYTEKVRRWL